MINERLKDPYVDEFTKLIGNFDQAFQYLERIHLAQRTRIDENHMKWDMHLIPLGGKGVLHYYAHFISKPMIQSLAFSKDRHLQPGKKPREEGYIELCVETRSYWWGLRKEQIAVVNLRTPKPKQPRYSISQSNPKLALPEIKKFYGELLFISPNTHQPTQSIVKV